MHKGELRTNISAKFDYMPFKFDLAELVQIRIDVSLKALFDQSIENFPRNQISLALSYFLLVCKDQATGSSTLYNTFVLTVQVISNNDMNLH